MQRFHVLQINACATRAGVDEHGIDTDRTFVSFVGVDVEIQVVLELRIDSLGVLAPASLVFEVENIILKK